MPETPLPDAARDFGAHLRRARESRGLSLRQIALTTKIAPMALEALERNDISRLPGGIFTRAFVRSYAAQVGLDPEETVRRFIERFPGDTVVAGSPYVQDATSEQKFESERRTASVLLGIIVISVPLAGLILFVTMRGGESMPASVSSAPAAGVAAVAEVLEATAAPPAEEEPLRLVLEASGPCWISLIIDGDRVFERVLQAGEREVREAREEIVLSVGDPGTLSFSINGEPGLPLGRPGQVVSARIDRDNYREFLEP